jgi:hypothetical protein
MSRAKNAASKNRPGASFIELGVSFFNNPAAGFFN